MPELNRPYAEEEKMIRDLEERHGFKPGDRVVLHLKEGYLEFGEIELVATYRGEDDHAMLVEVANWIPPEVVLGVEKYRGE